MKTILSRLNDKAQYKDFLSLTIKRINSIKNGITSNFIETRSLFLDNINKNCQTNVFTVKIRLFV